MILEIVFLGTAASVPSKERSLPCVAVKKGPDITLFDCGEGAQRQLMISSLSFMRIERVFLSHLHGDHILGLPGLLLTMNLNGRKGPLAVFGPVGTTAALDSMRELLLNGIGFDILSQDLHDGDVVKALGFSVEACSNEHNGDSLGYIYREHPKRGRFRKDKAISLGVPKGPLFSRLQKGESLTIGGRIIEPSEVCGPERPGRSISYSGDTLPSVTFQERSSKVDVMIHEATFLESEKELASTYFHSTARQAAVVARKAEVGKLILTHIGTRYKNPEEILIEAKKEFSNVYVAYDFLSVIVEFK